MKLQILFDTEAINNDFSIGWGISVLINKIILFDTGENEEYLFNNIKRLNINLAELEGIVISHDHWDHTGGLWSILKAKKGIKVYICPQFSSEFKDKVKNLNGKLIELDKFYGIEENIFVTGEIPGTNNGSYIPEQSVVIKSEKGISVITGCAHPGIINILKKVKEEFPEERFHLVFGGFHLANKDKRETELIVNSFKEMNIEKVGPTHCTGTEQEALFKKVYKDDCLSIKVGESIEV